MSERDPIVYRLPASPGEGTTFTFHADKDGIVVMSNSGATVIPFDGKKPIPDGGVRVSYREEVLDGKVVRRVWVALWPDGTTTEESA